MPRHKHADMIIEWAETCKPAQVLDKSRGKWIDIDYPKWDNFNSYRFKPEVIKYRRFLGKTKLDGEFYVGVTNYYEYIEQLENSNAFVRWIDTEWQEVEV